MLIAGDLREAPQDVVAPDLKAVVRGLSDLRDEVRVGHAALREDLRSLDQRLREEAQASEKRLREEIALARKQAEEQLVAFRDETRQHTALLRDDAKAAEIRAMERTQHLESAIRLESVSRRNIELERQLEEMRSAQQSQQH